MPLEQLLALYGYASSTSTSIDDSTKDSNVPSKRDHTQYTKPTESGSTVRSRRRNRVVPLQPQKEIPPDTDFPSSPTLPKATSGSEAERICNDAESRTGTEVVDTHERTDEGTKQDAAEQEDGKGTQQEVKMEAEQAPENQRGTKKPTELTSTRQEMDKGVGLPKRKLEGHEDTDGEEVDVLEVDEVDFGLTRDGETVLTLDEIQRAEFDVVRMGDIEAGLRIEGALGRYEEAELRGGEGAFVGYEEVGLEEQGAESREEEGGQQEEEDVDDGRDAEEMRRSLRKRSRNAVYDDVLLSSGNTRLLSDSAGRYTKYILLTFRFVNFVWYSLTRFVKD